MPTAKPRNPGNPRGKRRTNWSPYPDGSEIIGLRVQGIAGTWSLQRDLRYSVLHLGCQHTAVITHITLKRAARHKATFKVCPACRRKANIEAIRQRKNARIAGQDHRSLGAQGGYPCALNEGPQWPAPTCLPPWRYERK